VLLTTNLQILDYFDEAPSPLASKPFPYNQNTIKNLLSRLREFRLTKAEIIMIMNHRPANPENLNTVVEELEGRFDDEQQMAIVTAITEVLGKPDGEAERQAMTDNAKEARKEKLDLESRQEEAMDQGE
jgi:ribosome-binding ATPase YchF (GTP1/OBG family)